MASIPRESSLDRWGSGSALDERSRTRAETSEELQALREAISELRAYSPSQPGRHAVELLEDTHTAIAATDRAFKLILDESMRDDDDDEEMAPEPKEADEGKSLFGHATEGGHGPLYRALGVPHAPTASDQSHAPSSLQGARVVVGGAGGSGSGSGSSSPMRVVVRGSAGEASSSSSSSDGAAAGGGSSSSHAGGVSAGGATRGGGGGGASSSADAGSSSSATFSAEFGTGGELPWSPSSPSRTSGTSGTSRSSPARRRSNIVRYLVPLQDLLGPMPARTWQDEWDDLVIEMLLLRGYSRRDYANHTWVMQNNTIEHNKVNFSEEIEQLIAAGWSADRAVACVLLFAVRQSMARALRERDPCFAASTYALTDLLTEEARRQQRSATPPTRRLYINLRGAHGLEVDDPAWSQLEVPDAKGFRGLISNAVVKGESDPRNFSELGFCARETYVNNLVKYEVQNSDVVCFESAPADDEGLHAAVMFGDGPRGAFPPNTLFELVHVVDDGFEAPNGVFVRQRLLVVRATFAWQLTTQEAQRVAHVVLTSREARYTRALIGTCFFRDAPQSCAGVRLPLEVARHIARIAAEVKSTDEAEPK